jgi:hypothetical protein
MIIFYVCQWRHCRWQREEPGIEMLLEHGALTTPCRPLTEP